MEAPCGRVSRPRGDHQNGGPGKRGAEEQGPRHQVGRLPPGALTHGMSGRGAGEGDTEDIPRHPLGVGQAWDQVLCATKSEPPALGRSHCLLPVANHISWPDLPHLHPVKSSLCPHSPLLRLWPGYYQVSSPHSPCRVQCRPHTVEFGGARWAGG